MFAGHAFWWALFPTNLNGQAIKEMLIRIVMILTTRPSPGYQSVWGIMSALIGIKLSNHKATMAILCILLFSSIIFMVHSDHVLCRKFSS